MAKPHIHAMSSAKKFGGKWEDYIKIHELMDSSKGAFADNRHRALTHNAWFIRDILPNIFGDTFTNSDGKVVSIHSIGEQHVLEDFGMRFIPTVQDYLAHMDLLPWISNSRLTVPDSQKRLCNKVEPTLQEFKD